MKLTIGLPFYNNATTLAIAIRSVLAQTFDEWELILVDDGSTDESAKVANQFTDNRIRFLQDGMNLGLPSRLNQIAGLANGRFLARMDADDIMLPSRLEQQLQFLEMHPEIGVVGSAAYVIDNDLRLKGLRTPPEYPQNAEHMLRHSQFIHPSVVARTDWFRANPYDTSLRRSQDRELWLRTRHTTHFYNLQTPLLFLRDGGSMAYDKYARSASAGRKLIRQYGKEIIGDIGTLRLLAESFTKQAVFYAFERFSATETLIRKRSKPVSEREASEAEALLHAINSDPLPL